MENIEDLKDKVMQKINNEYDDFIKNLKQCEPEVIIDKAYEHVCKQEMIYLFEDKDLTVQECKALLKCPNILNDTYDEWLGTDANIHEILDLAVDNSIEHIVDDFKKDIKQKNKESR